TSTPPQALALRASHVLSDSSREPRSGRSGVKHWQPPEGSSPEDVRAFIAPARTERDRLLLRVLWATGGRISEVPALRPKAVQLAPVHPHLFRHAPVRQIVRQTGSLPLAQRQAGWARLQLLI